ncbi:heavy metal-associated isoprenylated plant protein 47-like [Morus notabilis]|uniref:heavy metal-associated isoprenylated plant protein 47-like n=1 Tax=Morus notabilis TaxID=981085 RepID=UPI000CED0A99|nr:heavy metal-associated isoprenylated plant protein 47-like [Morus notabilis]
MKQKIFLRVQMKCNKCKNKAMKKAAVAPGVSSVAIDGDKMVVTEDGIDPVRLTISLQKKLGYATIESVEELEKEEKKDEVKLTSLESVVYPQFPVRSSYYIYDDLNASFCSIF